MPVITQKTELFKFTVAETSEYDATEGEVRYRYFYVLQAGVSVE
jgi:hypothetical protein